MSTFRKFILINRNELDRVRERKIKEYNPNVQALARVEQSIEEVLANPVTSNDVKLKALSELNNKFEHLRPNKTTVRPITKQCIPVVVAPQNEAELPPLALTTPPPPPPPPIVDIPAPIPVLEAAHQAAAPGPAAAAALAVAGPVAALASADLAELPPLREEEIRLPDQYQNKFTQLLNIIKLSPNVIRAATTGELVINNTLIPHSKYIHAIRELYIRSQAHTTIGLGLFLSPLNQLNVPANLISNSARKAEYSQIIHSQPNAINLINTAKALKQKGKGILKSQPPGKRPRILLVFKK